MRFQFKGREFRPFFVQKLGGVMAITSIAQLQKAIEARVQKALQLTQDEIYVVVKKHLVAFYQAKDFPHGSSEGNSTWSNEPLYYQRTNTFLESLIKTQVVRVGNSLACSVQLDEDYLKYKYPGNPDWPGNVPATGLDVATWANDPSHDHTHGYTVGSRTGVAWWSDAMEELGGRQGILGIMKKNLKAVGVPIK